MVTPFGGPASGLWPSGSTPAPPQPVVGPPVPPPTPCVSADIFADCFAGCAGTISGGSPGPVCGWTFTTAFGGGGRIDFVPGQMQEHCDHGTDEPADFKPLNMPLPSLANITFQVLFSEFTVPVGGSTAYEWLLKTAGTGNVQRLYVALFGDGTVVVTVGTTGSRVRYTGTWTPNGGTHKVHLTLDGGLVPTLFIDGSPIALAVGLSIAPPVGAAPGSTVQIASSSDFAANVDTSAVYTGIFVASGVLPPSTVFCCPP